MAGITAAPTAKLTLVVGTAGSGKTTLLDEWRSAPEERRSFAWLSLDPSDNDPVKLFEAVIAALQTIEPRLGTRALESLRGSSSLTEVVLPSLINDLTPLPRGLVLVLDDYHLVDNPRIHEALAFLLERLPGTVQIALASRAEPPLGVGRLRVRGELVEVRAEDLRFTDDEAAALMSGALGFSLDEVDLARLQERTEGWAAGLQLAALSLGGRGDAHDFISSFAGDDRPVVDYLGFEVLDGQPQAAREFLVRTSILESLSGSLCDAVAGEKGSAARLDELERAGLFLFPTDSKREWYRCHQMFRELLRSELVRTDPGRVSELHLRASAWYRQHGAVTEAIRHATAGGDAATASELIVEHWYDFLQRGRSETIAGWLDDLGDDRVSGDAGLCLTKAWIGVNTGRLGDVGHWIEAAERAAGVAEVGGVVGAGIASLREIHCYMAGDVSAAAEAGHRSVALGDTPWRPLGCPVLGIALFWSGRPGEAALELRESVRVAQAAGNHLAVIHASGGLAAISAEGEDLEGSERVAAQTLEMADERGLAGHWATTMAHVVQGRALERRGRLPEASVAMQRGAELSRSGVASVEIAYALLSLADALQLQGESRTAIEVAKEARAAVEDCPDPGILREMLARTERRLHLASRLRPHEDYRLPDLTERELSVLALLPGELTQREIGAALYLSRNTIKTHVRGIYRKLNVETRDDAITRARELDLI